MLALILTRFTNKLLRTIRRPQRPSVCGIKKTIEGLAVFPGMGRVTERAHVRVMPVGRYPYLIFYKIDQGDAAVTVLHIRHGARRPFGQTPE